jgi:Kef-type K+ transport system membrane component KefB
MIDTLPIASEVTYLVLIVALLLVPSLLQRVLVPAPLTSFGLGLVAALFHSSFRQDTTVAFLATLGISALFLFAGLEIDHHALRRGKWVLISHLLARSCVIGAGVWAGVRYLDLSWQVAALLSLAFLTPSTGFILETLDRLGLDDEERFWVSIKAIGGEVLALLILFAVLRSDSVDALALSTAALVAMMVLIPLLFIVLNRWVMPYAPGSWFSVLVMVGLLAAYVTKVMGVYYLIGAFVTGVVAKMLRERVPELAAEENLRAVRLFAGFFVPFYFFYRGMLVPDGAMTWDSLLLGVLAAILVLPFRIGGVWLQRRIAFHESARSSLNVGMALAPTLIFTLVLAAILRERYGIPDSWYGGLLVYAALSTLLPSIVLSKPFEIDFVGPRLPGLATAASRQRASDETIAPAMQARSPFDAPARDVGRRD